MAWRIPKLKWALKSQDLVGDEEGPGVAMPYFEQRVDYYFNQEHKAHIHSRWKWEKAGSNHQWAEWAHYVKYIKNLSHYLQIMERVVWLDLLNEGQAVGE